MAYDHAGNVMRCGSFSKTLSPGLKVGWIEPGRWRDRIRMLKFVASGGQNELMGLAVAELLESGGYERQPRPLRRPFEWPGERRRGPTPRAFPPRTRGPTTSGA